MTARRPLGWLLFAFLALAVAVMHTGVLGGCANQNASSAAAMAMSATAMSHSGSSSVPEAPQGPDHASSHLCASTLPPSPASIGAALGLLLILTAALITPAVGPHRRFFATRWWPPPPPLSSLCVWRI
jgi:hypothetical protein